MLSLLLVVFNCKGAATFLRLLLLVASSRTCVFFKCVCCVDENKIEWIKLSVFVLYLHVEAIIPVYTCISHLAFSNKTSLIKDFVLFPPRGGVLRKYLYGDAQSRLQNVDHLYTCVLEKKKKKKKTHPITNTSLLTKQPISIPFLLKWWPILIIFISKTAHRHTITEIRGH